MMKKGSKKDIIKYGYEIKEEQNRYNKYVY